MLVLLPFSNIQTSAMTKVRENQQKNIPQLITLMCEILLAHDVYAWTIVSTQALWSLLPLLWSPYLQTPSPLKMTKTDFVFAKSGRDVLSNLSLFQHNRRRAAAKN
ncbi:hypothetical protein T4D_11321 [Trichinella pseudospiralis]|uniref:Uncharacterized protein n=1 Tax=Trichinella pseudospiralis TaxID=6337 RepID=A0A0V1G120_TRIPS|nr:hypothetical protein T4D_11321 [Trichinella pseudospiralis]